MGISFTGQNQVDMPPHGGKALYAPVTPRLIVPPQDLEQARWFDQEVQPHERSVRSYLRRSLPSLSDVDDIMQDCFSRILRAWKRGQVKSPRPMLFTIARHAVHDFFLYRGRAELVPISEYTEQPLLDENPGVVEMVCQRQELALLGEAIKNLPPRCQEVMLLRKIKGLSQKKIAAALGISENTVEALAAKGARRCAEYLRTHGVSREQNYHVS